MGSYYKIEYSKHDKNDPLFVTETRRRCVNCPEEAAIHECRSFKIDRHQPGIYSTICGDCITKIRAAEKRAKEDAAAEVLTGLIANSVKHNREDGGYSDDISVVCGAMGSREKAFRLVGRMAGRCLRRGLSRHASGSDMDRGLDASKELLKASATEEKLKGPRLNLDAMEDEEIREGIVMAAKRLAVDDTEFRKALINDPAVRRLLLKDLGVEVLDAETSDAV